MEEKFRLIKNFIHSNKFYRKSYEGQNFLFHTPTLQRIVKSSGITKDDFVVEIGSGPSNLTLFAAEEARFVLGIEKDIRFKELHESLFSNHNNIKFLYIDALSLKREQLTEIIKEKFPDLNILKNLKVIGNIPYQITSPLLTKLVTDFEFSTHTFLIQKEVAERIISKPNSKRYGIMSVRVQYFCKTEIKFLVKPELFSPPPQVISALLHLEKKPFVSLAGVNEQKKFFKMVESMFNKRRKTIVNSIEGSNLFSLSRLEIIERIKSLGIDDKRRPETLSLDDFINIYISLQK